eukprot:1373916-Amorphochlora_amoeboformis.AAC.1
MKWQVTINSMLSSIKSQVLPIKTKLSSTNNCQVPMNTILSSSHNQEHGSYTDKMPCFKTKTISPWMRVGVQRHLNIHTCVAVDTRVAVYVGVHVDVDVDVD